MTYRVIQAPSFREDIDGHIGYLLGENVALHIINEWYAKLFDLITNLDKSPRRFPVDEVQSRITGHETHKLNKIVIAKAGKPVARLVGYTQPSGPRTGGQWRGRVRMADDFDAPLPPDVAGPFHGLVN